MGISTNFYFATGALALLNACSTSPNIGTDATNKAVVPVGVAARNAELIPPTTGALNQFPATENAVKSKPNESPAEQSVRLRAQKRWEHLVKGDIDLAYTYLSPNSRLAQPLDVYKSRIRVGFWQSADVIRVDCAEASRCVVQSKVRVKMPGIRGGLIDHESVVSEDWLGLTGEWWYVPSPR